MSEDAEWLRLNSDWMHTKWLRDLRKIAYPANLILPVLLAHMKAWGNNRGKCKELDPEAFADLYKLRVEDAEAFFAAAFAAGAIAVEKGQWVLPNWALYQSADAIRKRKLRSENPEIVPDNPELSGTNPTCPGLLARQDKTIQDKTEKKDPTGSKENPGLAAADRAAMGELLFRLPSEYQSQAITSAFESFLILFDKRSLTPWTSDEITAKCAEWQGFTPDQILEAIKKANDGKWKNIFPKKPAVKSQATNGKPQSQQSLDERASGTLKEIYETNN